MKYELVKKFVDTDIKWLHGSGHNLLSAYNNNNKVACDWFLPIWVCLLNLMHLCNPKNLFVN